MSIRTSNPIDYDSLIRAWERGAPWYRRILARIGLQGKIICTFSFLLLLAVAGCYTLFVSESRRMLQRTSGESAIQIAQTLAKAGERALLSGNHPELARISQDLLRDPDIITIAFFDSRGESIIVACQDPDYPLTQPDLLPSPVHNTQHLMQVRRGESPVLGAYAQVTVPVIAIHYAAPATGSPDGASRLAGFVSVIRSDHAAQQHLRRARILALLVGSGVFILSLPVIFAMVHRIFYPIRQLVVATNRIAAGDLDAEVAIHRPDTIGALARAFNEMTLRVRQHQQDLHQANARLADANRDLEQRIEQRTAQLQSANHRLSAEIAEKEDFLRAVSHDLNAPLRNIAGMTTMLMMKYRDVFDPEVMHRLERIQKNVQVETDLINELLELSRIRTRRQKMECVQLQDLLEDVVGLFENDLRTRDIQLIFDTPLPVVHGERARLRQVFQNLIDNAIKYMGEGTIDPGTRQRTKQIRIGAVIHPRGAEFYVSDTGVGIDPEDLEKIFFVFRRGRRSSTAGAVGKGVGLASVKSIIETHGGTIRVESRPGAGSTFRFTIDGQNVPGTLPSHAA